MERKILIVNCEPITKSMIFFFLGQGGEGITRFFFVVIPRVSFYCLLVKTCFFPFPFSLFYAVEGLAFVDRSIYTPCGGDMAFSKYKNNARQRQK